MHPLLNANARKAELRPVFGICSDSEKKMLEDFADLVNDIPACKSASEAELDAMGVKYNKCGVDHLQGISAACFKGRAGESASAVMTAGSRAPRVRKA